MKHHFEMSLDHVQLAIPAGSEEACRQFYAVVLGMTEVEKPPELAGRGGLWLRSGNLNLHLGTEEEFVSASKAHPGIRVADVQQLAERLVANGIEIRWDDNLPGFDRFYT